MCLLRRIPAIRTYGLLSPVAHQPRRKVGLFCVPNYIGTFVMSVGNSALTLNSSNKKTGPIAVSTNGWSTCPADCGMADECYAYKGYHTRIHGDKVERGERGVPFEEFAIKLSRLPEWMLYRGQVGGDLWHFGGKVSRYHVLKVADSVSHLRHAWTYTHHKPDRHNAPTIREAIKRGFTINISTDGVKNKVLRKEGLDDAARYFKRGLPTVCAVPADTKRTFEHKGVRFVQCPEQVNKDVQCATCNRGNPLCSQADRSFVVTFNLH